MGSATPCVGESSRLASFSERPLGGCKKPKADAPVCGTGCVAVLALAAGLAAGATAWFDTVLGPDAGLEAPASADFGLRAGMISIPGDVPLMMPSRLSYRLPGVATRGAGGAGCAHDTETLNTVMLATKINEPDFIAR